MHALEPVQQEQARRRLDRYVTHCDPIIVPAAHHRLLIAQLHEVYEGRLKRLMVFWPPGHAKSTYSSHYGPAFFMGRHPRRNLIHCSHTMDLAERFGRKIRNTLLSPESIDVFGQVIAGDSRASGRWDTVKGGEYYAAGVGGAIAGRRSHLGIIDDPVKSRKEADSPTYRETTWQWYLGDFRTRMLPGAGIIIIQTRWHEDDLSGRILPADYKGDSGWVRAKDGESWYVLNFPAICEREDDGTSRAIGEALWPAFFTLEALEQERISQGSRNWEALYQQRPRPGEGGIFKEAWFSHNRYREIPVECKTIVHSWDTAQKPEEINAPSGLTVWSYGRPYPGYYLREAWAERVDYPTLKRKVLNFAERDHPACILIEDKSSGQSLIQELRNDTSLPIVAIEPEGNKLFRASEVSSMCEAGLVHLPYIASWLVNYEGELFGFPLATTNDLVDSTSQFLRWARLTMGRLLESHGAGMTRSMAEQLIRPREDQQEGYGSIGRGDGENDMTGFN